ncbi:response regulator [Chitinophaga japonensis]|uniref:Response regulator receiver domain-containing protein n=1 Tax=Chitinophaga japonensis TaxID=104662 RepID=A0A562T623_CHIJA|nr:response regulator [Chitinophaga japonensis]TWI88718.1 response regulator receiver domain-containing protein [Chitinophaga japonensis]
MNRTILLIEDKPSLLDTLKSLLELHQYRVIVAANGAEGVAQARLNQPDLVISDIYMPVLNGYELLELFKQDDALRKIPVIMLTAKTEIEEIDLALEKGADGYVTKPFVFKNLHAVIQKILNKGTEEM